ncbi:MAG TPA: hypothetical protein DDZ88_25325 [Verrucomicrobiales bacterium]|nr:hypothetical protein [Verrucomicrobiales bacterium]
MQLIPSTDLTEYLQLPAEVRRDVDLWTTRLCGLTPPIQRSLAQVAAGAGVSVQTARRKYDALRHRGWRGLINLAKCPGADRSHLSPEFIEYWKSLCQSNGRKCRPAYREFLRQFRAGHLIPGIEPGTPRHTLPTGYTYANLIRHKPTRFELAAARIGRGTAADLRPKVFTTRVGLQVGQRYIFDDMWHDFLVVALGQRKPARLLQLHAHDLYSACQFTRGLKPRLEDPESGKSVGLNEDEMVFLVTHVLAEYGYHYDGCVLMVEHGTAAISEALEQQLYDLTAGRVTVDRSGIQGASAFAGQYLGRGKGNFRFKSSLESLGNLIHNETANLLAFPGQTGSNSRTNLPEELHGRQRHADALACALAALPAAVATQLRLPFLEVNQAKMLVDEIMERINRRTDHALEGWVEAGLTTCDFEVPGVGLIPSAKFLALPPERRAAVQALASPAPRRLSPREVFEAGRSALVTLRPEHTAALLKDKHGREVVVGHDHLITFEDAALCPSPLRYLAHTLAPGDKYLAAVNPWSLETLHLFDARGAWVGCVRAWQTISHTDTEALHRQMGRAAQIERDLLRPVAARGAALTRARLDDARHNATVLKTVRREDLKQTVSESDAAADARALFLSSTL